MVGYWRCSRRAEKSYKTSSWTCCGSFLKLKMKIKCRLCRHVLEAQSPMTSTKDTTPWVIWVFWVMDMGLWAAIKAAWLHWAIWVHNVFDRRDNLFHFLISGLLHFLLVIQAQELGKNFFENRKSTEEISSYYFVPDAAAKVLVPVCFSSDSYAFSSFRAIMILYNFEQCVQ